MYFSRHSFLKTTRTSSLYARRESNIARWLADFVLLSYSCSSLSSIFLRFSKCYLSRWWTTKLRSRSYLWLVLICPHFREAYIVVSLFFSDSPSLGPPLGQICVKPHWIHKLPWWLLVSFGSYALWCLGWGLFTFRDCPEAYTELLGVRLHCFMPFSDHILRVFFNRHIIIYLTILISFPYWGFFRISLF